MTQPHSPSDFTFKQVDPRAPDAVACLTQFYEELATRLRSGFEVHLSADPSAADMMTPNGAFIVVYRGETPVACGGLKGHGDWGEVKRVWVSLSVRGHGVAKQIMTTLETKARAMGLRTLRLDTNSALPEAVAMYPRLGWHEIERFNDDPYPDHFFEKHL
ncbi:MAG: GNAT family N-acetyltransferase [Maritimibacter sp.]